MPELITLITPAALQRSKWRQTMHADGRDFFIDMKTCVDFPGLSVSIKTMRRGRAGGGREFYVDGCDETFADLQEAAKAWNDVQIRTGAVPVPERRRASPAGAEARA